MALHSKKDRNSGCIEKFTATLEFALAKIPSLGVGRLDSLFMHPLTFLEYLEALDHSQWVSAVQKATFSEGLHAIRTEFFDSRKYHLRPDLCCGSG